MTRLFELGSEMKEHRKYMDSLITGALNDEEEKRTQKLLTKVYEHMYQDNDKCEKIGYIFTLICSVLHF